MSESEAEIFCDFVFWVVREEENKKHDRRQHIKTKHVPSFLLFIDKIASILLFPRNNRFSTHLKMLVFNKNKTTITFSIAVTYQKLAQLTGVFVFVSVHTYSLLGIRSFSSPSSSSSFCFNSVYTVIKIS